MTKINKLGKSTFVIAILSFILVAVLAFGGTYAYFSATAGQNAARITTGHLKMSVNDDNTVADSFEALGVDEKIAQPGQVLIGSTTNGTTEAATITATVDANIKYYLRVKFDVKVTPGTINAEGEWEEATDKTHDGIVTPEDILNNVEEDTDADAEDVDEVGDNVSDDIAILEIFLSVNDTEWVEFMDEGKHTGYFYGAADATPVQHAVADTDETYAMEVLVNLQDWVGAYGCTYYMDAKIEIRFQIETLQADYLDEVKLGNGVDFSGTDATTGMAVPASIAELHKAWDYAVAYSQPTTPVAPQD